ncbi:MAG: extracellular solute-binding protein [Clostridia bacterium]|nr:extracellular solute-binding protein [Clostridia bacterium]
MKHVVRSLCLLMALLIAVLAAACTETPTQTSSEPEPVSGPESQPQESSEETHELFYNLPTDKYYEGETVTFLVVGDYAEAYKSQEVMPQESSYEVLQKNIKDRNDLVTEKFGATIDEFRTASGADMLDKVRNGSLSGVSEFDIIMPYMYDAATLAMEGYFMDLNTLPNVHLSESYYDQNSVEGFSIRGKNYFVSGDLCLLDYACTHALVFNKDMIKEHDLESPYDLVENKQWTLDKMQEMAHGVASDNDGTPGMSYTDTYGFLVNQNFATSMFVGCGFRLTEKDANDEPVVALGKESAATAFQKIYDLVNDDTSVGRIDDLSGPYYTSASANGKICWVAATESVANKKALFRAVAIIDVFDLGEYECNFGLLPTPMYNTNQDKYLCRVSTICSSCVAIPTTARDPEMSSIILDAIMQASTESSKKAYFQTILKERKIQDNESEKMLDYIFSGRVYDLAYLYDWGGSGTLLSGFMNTIAFSDSNTYVSTWDSIKAATEASIAETVQAYRSIE